MRHWFQRIVLRRRWAAFAVLGLSFLLFGAGTANLAMLLLANLDLLARHGLMAVMDGAALQLLQIVLTAYLSMAAYLVFKACEHRLVEDLCEPGDPA